MSDGQRPWWASSTDGGEVSTDGGEVSTDGGEVSTDGGRAMNGGRTTTEDPMEAHRAARRGSVPPGAPRTSEPASDPSSAEPPHAHADAICGVCPICVLARTLGDTHPELLGHLTEAARHLAAAARAMLDTPGPPDPGTDRVQRIDLD